MNNPYRSYSDDELKRVLANGEPPRAAVLEACERYVNGRVRGTYKEGYDEGYRQGFTKGDKQGFERGYNEAP
jgi:hypothetical protein